MTCKKALFFKLEITVWQTKNKFCNFKKNQSFLNQFFQNVSFLTFYYFFFLCKMVISPLYGSVKPRLTLILHCVISCCHGNDGTGLLKFKEILMISGLGLHTCTRLYEPLRPLVGRLVAVCEAHTTYGLVCSQIERACPNAM